MTEDKNMIKYPVKRGDLYSFFSFCRVESFPPLVSPSAISSFSSFLVSLVADEGSGPFGLAAASIFFRTYNSTIVY
ncbi:unnamed protein product [Pseudo-nitzschia multistriata]|uniref:Uncharacterized protein n=1 Tax=Pseudo-nitzschia multistriata TaxID=183589 RepID=A0A448ZN99_9STRA|nr:unnamed protein product [Pseudo-nitzschia multistriata]